MRLLPQPNVPGKTKGIISMDPLTLQCGECGEVAVNEERLGIARFIIRTRWLFCLHESDRGGGPRRCGECQTRHRQTCGRCARR